MKFAKPKPKENHNPREVVYVRVGEELRDKLDILCTREDRNVSSMIRILIVEAIEARQKAKATA